MSSELNNSNPGGGDEPIEPVTGSEFFSRGQELFEQGDLDGALYCIDRALDLWHVDADICLVKGQILMEMKRADEALHWLGRAVQMNPLSPDVHLWKGRALHQLQRFRAALACFGRALDQDPLNSDVHLTRGMSLLELGETDTAEEAFRTARETAHHNPDREAEVDYWLARIERSRGNIGRARRMLERVIKRNDSYVSACAELGDLLRTHARDEGDLRRACEIYQRGLDAEPDDPALHNDYGNLLRELRDLDGSVRHLGRALEINPQHEVAWFNRGLTHEEKGDHRAAADDFREAVRIDPADVDARLRMADNLLLLGRYQDAHDAADEVLELEPGNSEALLCIGDVLNRQALAAEAAGDYAGAAACLRRLMEQAPDLVNVDEYEPLFASPEERYAAGVEGYRQLALDRPADGTPRLLMAVHMVRIGEFTTAEGVLDEYVTDYADDAFGWALRAVCATELGEPGRAVSCLDRALELRPSFVELQWEKAALLEAEPLCDLDGAIGCYQAILDNSGTHRWVHEPLARLYDETGEPEKALWHLRRHEQFLDEIGLRERLEGQLEWAYGRVRLGLGQPRAALVHLHRAMELAPPQAAAPSGGSAPVGTAVLRAAAEARRSAQSPAGPEAPDPADAALEEAAAIHRGEVQLLLGLAYRQLGRFKESASYLHKVVEEYRPGPGQPASESSDEAASDISLAAEAMTALAAIAVRRRRFEEAERSLADASRLVPKQTREQLLARAELEFARRSIGRAREYLDRVLLRSPRRDTVYLQGLLLQARLAWHQQDLFLAQESVDEILASDPWDQRALALRVWLARTNGQMRELEQAERDYRMAGAFHRIRALLSGDEPGLALREIGRCPGSWTGRPDFQFLKAAAHARMGDVAAVCEVLQRALSLDPSLGDELLLEPAFDAVLPDPRVRRVIERSGGSRSDALLPAIVPTPRPDANEAGIVPDAAPASREASRSADRPGTDARSDDDLIRDAEFGIDWDSLLD